jgi:tagatose-6-phosphate ketose/aldose isomerase
MQSILDVPDKVLTEAGGLHTAREIAQQPEVWPEVFSLIRSRESEIARFMTASVEKSNQIILTGAGTSAFIGISLEREFQKRWGIPSRAVATTDLVTHPTNYFDRRARILLISFARSGNSPESCASVEAAEQLAGSVMHLIITCDPDGNLANSKKAAERLVLVLPPETNDRSLAMTSSYTGMMLAGLLVSRINSLEKQKESVQSLVRYGRSILTNYVPKLREVAGLGFNRAVFLGSGPQLGTATESHLKLQELTDGKVICKMDTFLGFRHGPKAVVNGESLVVYLFSNNKHSLRYERDLATAMKREMQGMYMIGVFETSSVQEFIGETMDLPIVLSESINHLDEEYLCICNVLPAQILGFFKSMELGLSPDNPSERGAISRVVQGVNIYQYE